MTTLADAVMAASLFAIDPAGMGGVCIRSPVHPARDQWLQLLRDFLPAGTPVRRAPCNISDGRLLGGLDLAATLKANRPMVEQGVLAAADGGVVVISMAERLTPHTAACLNGVMDAGEIVLAREGVFIRNQARVGIVALDEGASEEESAPVTLLDRLAFLLDFNGFSVRTVLVPEHDIGQILAARVLLPQVRCDGEMVSAICATALALGAGSPRVSVLAVRTARAAAALDGRIEVRESDAVLAGRLVLAPRATLAPTPQKESTGEAQPDSGDEGPAEAQADIPDHLSEARPDLGANSAEAAPDLGADPVNQPAQSHAAESPDNPLEKNSDGLDDVVLSATRAAIPAKLLARLRAGMGGRNARSGAAGRAGALRAAASHGRPCGVRSGAARGKARLSVIETLRAAAPWQGLRGRQTRPDSRILITPDDFRVVRYRRRSQTLTVFAVDASGSSALHRLGEAKGAVELLLADCYIRRDQVAVIAFRGRAADVLLPPTRSLVRAKRCLADLAGGGGTPLAAGIEAAAKLADQATRRGETPTIVILTDGRANVARSGAGGRAAAWAEAVRAAITVRASKIAALFIDTSPRPNPAATDLARMMNAKYIPLPFANARALSGIVTAMTVSMGK
jgi:magnesium chelatase subunit D